MITKIHEFINLVPKINELYPHILLLQIITSITTNLLNFVNVLFLGIELNLLFNTSVNKLKILSWTSLFIGIILVLSIVSKILDNYTEKQTRLINTRAQTNMSKHLVEVDYETFENTDFRSLYNDVKSGLEFVGGFQSFVKNVINNIISFITTLFLSGGILFSVIIIPSKKTDIYDIVLPFAIIILVLSILFLSFFCGKKFGKIMNDFFSFNIHFNQILNYYFDQAFKTIHVKKLLQLFDPTQQFFKCAKTEILKEVNIDRKLQVKATNIASLPTVFINIIIGIFYILLGMIIFKKNLGVGTIVTSVGTLQLLIFNLSSLLNSLGNSGSSFNVIKKYFKFMNSGQIDSKKTIPMNIVNKNFEICFHDVSYKYPNRQDYALKNINFTLKAGEKIAVVGKNGSGKTTLVKLILRLLTPTSGIITLNGIDIQKIKLSNYQNLFSTVPQNTFVFADTVCNNICLGMEKNEKTVIDSLRKIRMNKILAFKKGINTELTTQLSKNGLDLSGGETQEIGISRALYKNSEIYVLDEPTASLDPIKEKKIFNDIIKLSKGHTTLFISHRMSLTNNSDFIYVLDSGNIVERGTHASLMRKRALYYKMYKAQQNYFKK